MSINTNRPTIVNSRQAYEFLKNHMIADVEELWAVALDASQGVRQWRCLHRGTVDQCLVYPRDIFRFGCENNASSLLIAHNHPSDNLIPSSEDLRITKKLVQLGQMMAIPVVDHLILGQFGYISLADLKLAGFGRSLRR